MRYDFAIGLLKIALWVLSGVKEKILIRHLVAIHLILLAMWISPEVKAGPDDVDQLKAREGE